MLVYMFQLNKSRKGNLAWKLHEVYVIKMNFQFYVSKMKLNLQSFYHNVYHILVKVFKNGPSKICGRQASNTLKWYGLPSRSYHNHITSNFSKAVFHKFHLVNSWIPWPISY